MPVNNTALKLLGDSGNGLPDEYVRQLKRIQKDLVSELQVIGKKLQLDPSGRILSNKVNLEILNRMNAEITNFLQASGYRSLNREFIQSYDQIISSTSQSFVKANVLTEFASFDFDFFAKLKTEDFNVLNGKGAEFERSMQSNLTRAVTGNIEFKELIKNLNALAVGENAGIKPLSISSETFARTAMSNFTRTVSLVTAKKAGLKKARYSGSLVRDSRDFCIEHVKNIYSLEEIESFNNLDWQGKMQGVDVKIAMGGWNCIHIWDWLTDEEYEEYE